ncbi:peptidyl-prolyl cis-trans isomerase [Pyxidicoccus parkwayensis]|uniref:Peptidyl-prolyl cis-trans isomerase n=1 Tax=Pyxidicoccus parkwayensis TaxID=2813578 RepID=A0ABX7NTV1_9BACT|nr:SurA N-terminal domain-containing protein [Pyxidicoccus parkwaysis]QSQ20950.1 peptidyl-prolyl cis-trans isomerase [Pyxidicoccus parkwaysis]
MLKYSQRLSNFRQRAWLRSVASSLWLLSAPLFLSSPAFASNDSSADAPETEVIAIVDGDEVSPERFNSIWKAQVQSLRLKNGQIPEVATRAQKVQLSEFLIEELLLEHEGEQQKIEVSEQQIDAELRGRPPPGISNQELTYARRKARLDLLCERLIEQKNPAPLTEETIRQFYERHHDRFREPEPKPFEAVKDSIARELQELLHKTHRARLIDELRSRATIKNMLADRQAPYLARPVTGQAQRKPEKTDSILSPRQNQSVPAPSH